MEQGVTITTGMFTFAVFVVGAISGLIGWAWSFVKNKVIRDNYIDISLKAVKKIGKENAKKQKSDKKKVFLEIQKFANHESEIQKVATKQIQSEKDFKELKSEMKDIGNTVRANESILNGILSTVKSIDEYYKHSINQNKNV